MSGRLQSAWCWWEPRTKNWLLLEKKNIAVFPIVGKPSAGIQHKWALGRASLIHLVWSDSNHLTLNRTLFTRQRVNGSVWTVGCSFFSNWNVLILRSTKCFQRGTPRSTHTVQTPPNIKTKHHVDYCLGQSWIEVKASQLAGVKSNLNWRVNGLTKPGLQSEVTAVWLWTQTTGKVPTNCSATLDDVFEDQKKEEKGRTGRRGNVQLRQTLTQSNSTTVPWADSSPNCWTVPAGGNFGPTPLLFELTLKQSWITAAAICLSPNYQHRPISNQRSNRACQE